MKGFTQQCDSHRYLKAHPAVLGVGLEVNSKGRQNSNVIRIIQTIKDDAKEMEKRDL